MHLSRLKREKGVLDLASAFTQVSDKYSNAVLRVVGPNEAGHFQQMQVLLVKPISQVKGVKFAHKPERFIQVVDLFCLLSFREGFGSSMIEAAACGIPTSASRICGLTDAVIEGQTG